MLFRILKDEVQAHFKRRISVFGMFLFAFMAAIVLRLIYLQVVRYDHYRELADNNRIRIVNIPAERGFIKSREGTLLVKNSPSYQLVVIKEDVQDLDKLLREINEVLPIDVEKVRERVKKSFYYQSTILARGLSFDQVAYFLEHTAEYPGISIDLDSVRSYMDGTSVSHVLGYMGEVTEKDLGKNPHYQLGDSVGKTGLEKFYEDVLRGVDGARQMEVDSYGRALDLLAEREAIPGRNLVLTIDYGLQQFISQIMAAHKGSVVLMDVNGNKIISMVSSPSFDLNLFTPYIGDEDWKKLITDPYKPLLNRPIEGKYPPGSVYKVLMAAVALKEGVVHPDQTYDCSGTFHYSNFDYRCWQRKGHGIVDLQRSLSESCDTYYYNIGLKMGIDMIADYSQKLSLGSVTGIDLPNEKSGTFPSREWKKKRFKRVWYPGETVITSIGQGYISTTPMQIAVMMSGIFNGGIVYEPRVVDAIESLDGTGFERVKPAVVNKVVIPDKVAKTVMDGLVAVIEEPKGTGWRAKVPELHFGGKTGTAQVVSLKKTEHMDDNAIPEHMRDHSWFTAVFPADKPRYVIVIMAEHGGSGGSSAAPIAGAIINRMVSMGYVQKSPKEN